MNLLEKIKEEERKIHGELVELSQKIYEHPELGHQEFEACRLHTERNTVLKWKWGLRG